MDLDFVASVIVQLNLAASSTNCMQLACHRLQTSSHGPAVQLIQDFLSSYIGAVHHAAAAAAAA
jgi:hypothetical protein